MLCGLLDRRDREPLSRPGKVLMLRCRQGLHDIRQLVQRIGRRQKFRSNLRPGLRAQGAAIRRLLLIV